MLKLAAALAAPFGFVRVALYSLGRRLIFSEVTFTPLYGVWLAPWSWDKEPGARWSEDSMTWTEAPVQFVQIWHTRAGLEVYLARSMQRPTAAWRRSHLKL